MLRMFTCQQCGKKFKPHHKNSKYCSRFCFYTSLRRSVTIKCQGCDKPLEVSPHYAQVRKYCSKACYRIAMHENALSNQLYVCKCCGKTFTPVKKSRLYCSMKCMFKDAEKRVEFTCETCGEKFIDREILNRRFCSNQCRGQWQSKSRAGENSPTWKGGHNPYYGPNWTGQSRKARKRDKYICQICGLNQEFPRLDVHHIVPLREFDSDWKIANQLNNLITLCISCHNRVESGTVLCPQPNPS